MIIQKEIQRNTNRRKKVLDDKDNGQHKETVKKRKNVFENKNPFNQNKLPTVAREDQDRIN